MFFSLIFKSAPFKWRKYLKQRHMIFFFSSQMYLSSIFSEWNDNCWSRKLSSRSRMHMHLCEWYITRIWICLQDHWGFAGDGKTQSRGAGEGTHTTLPRVCPFISLQIEVTGEGFSSGCSLLSGGGFDLWWICRCPGSIARVDRPSFNPDSPMTLLSSCNTAVSRHSKMKGLPNESTRRTCNLYVPLQFLNKRHPLLNFSFKTIDKEKEFSLEYVYEPNWDLERNAILFFIELSSR